jgi:hypothetical protein
MNGVSANYITGTANKIALQATGGAFSLSLWDIVVISVFVVAAVSFTFIIGRGRIVYSMVVGYITFSLWHVFPIASIVKNVGDGETFALRIAIFFTIFILLFTLLRNSPLSFDVKLSKGRYSTIAKTLLFSVIQVGFFLNIIFSFLPAKGELAIAPITQFLFYSSYSSMVWISLPVAALMLLRDRKF